MTVNNRFPIDHCVPPSGAKHSGPRVILTYGNNVAHAVYFGISDEILCSPMASLTGDSSMHETSPHGRTPTGRKDRTVG